VNNVTTKVGDGVKTVCDWLEEHQGLVAAVVVVLLLVVIYLLYMRWRGEGYESNVTLDQTSGLVGFAGMRSDGVYGSCTGNEQPGTAAFADCQARRTQPYGNEGLLVGNTTPGVNYFARNDHMVATPSAVSNVSNAMPLATLAALQGH
jgi:hypothetical protein